jgi:glyoxylase-like metal-dependent hydrolase (beta-lactamase superfamily II)
MMKYLLIILAIYITPAHANNLDSINQKSWIHGAEDCDNNRDPAIDVFQFDENTYILRQNRCLNFEAPFIYILFGEHTVFIQDTGATAEAELFPLYETVQKLIAERTNSDLNILVTHSHSHGDHTAADQQFLGKPGVTLIEPDTESVQQYFGLNNWPDGIAKIDLGERELTVIPIPGHQAESIAVYDAQTRFLLTGDTFYPGRLYIREWDSYKSSIQKLVEFSANNSISAILGTHIEMSKDAGKDYPVGNSYQPNEAVLALSVDDLSLLNTSLNELGARPQQKVLSKFIISPVGALQKYIGGVLGWLKKKTR